MQALLGGFSGSWSFKSRIPKLELGNEQALNIRQTVDKHKDTCPPYATRAGID
ncbi:MAG: hypothetical protein WCI11_03010 [Candidatus Methylumidiphilus sp.]